MLHLLPPPDGRYGMCGTVHEKTILRAISNVVNTIFTLSPPCPAWSKGGESTGLYATDGWDFLEFTHLCQLGKPLACIFECSDDVDKHKGFIHIDHVMQLAGFKKVLSQNVPVHELSRQLEDTLVWDLVERGCRHLTKISATACCTKHGTLEFRPLQVQAPTFLGRRAEAWWTPTWRLRRQEKILAGPQTRQQVLARRFAWLKDAPANALCLIWKPTSSPCLALASQRPLHLPWLWPGHVEVFLSIYFRLPDGVYSTVGLSEQPCIHLQADRQCSYRPMRPCFLPQPSTCFLMNR